MKYLLDTCICIYWLRGKYHVAEMIDKVGLVHCFISEITIAELKYGDAYAKIKGGEKYKDQHLDRFLDNIRIIPLSIAFDRYAKEKARLRLAGTPVQDFDLLIGVTAVEERMTLVTENISDFQNIEGIKLQNWIKR